MSKGNKPTLTGYKKRKQERVDEYNTYVKYWCIHECTACNGSGYYDNDGSPDCDACDGTGEEWYKPNYEAGLTGSESLLGSVLTLTVSDLVDLRIYVNKRREVIYQYEDMANPDKKERVRARLHFGYTPTGRHEDWFFQDRDGDKIYLGECTITKTK